MPEHLHRIEMQHHACAAAERSDALHRLHGAHFALAPDQRHQARGRSQQRLERLEINGPQPIHRHLLHQPAATLHGRRRRSAGWMFHGREQQSWSLAGGGHLQRRCAAQQGQMDRLSAA